MEVKGHLYWKLIGHEPCDIKHGRFSPWGDRFAVLDRGVCNTRQPFMLAASLIAHRHQIQKRRTFLKRRWWKGSENVPPKSVVKKRKEREKKGKSRIYFSPNSSVILEGQKKVVDVLQTKKRF